MAQATAYSGVDGIVTANGTDFDVKGWSADVERELWDKSTTAGLGWQGKGYGLKKVTGSFDFFYSATKSPYKSPQSLFSGTDVTLVLKTGGSDQLSGPAAITKLSHKSDVKDGIMITASFESTDPWTLPT